MSNIAKDLTVASNGEIVSKGGGRGEREDQGSSDDGDVEGEESQSGQGEDE